MQYLRSLPILSKVNYKNVARFSEINKAPSILFNDKPEKSGLHITTQHRPSTLRRILDVFETNGVPVSRIKSTILNKKDDGHQDVIYHVNFDPRAKDSSLEKVINEFSGFAKVSVEDCIYEVPWFPQSVKELNMQARDLIPIEGDDHPMYWDKEYQKRRDELANFSKGTKIGEPIPYLEYSENEKKTWTYVHNRIKPLHTKYMCKEFNEVSAKWEKDCDVTADDIPQLELVSQWLQAQTGFRMKPVHGILSQRQFLNGLAFKVFYCTQYVRHHERPEYSPEPDVIHELFGHASMLGEKTFADLSQQFGLLSLGTSDENLAKLGALYWYTVEAGACKENGQVKAFGASISSSIAELQHFASEKAKYKTLDPFRELPFDIKLQILQQKYYVAESFKSAQHVLLKFGESLQRPFAAWYNASTEKIEIDKNIVFKKEEKTENLEAHL